jgi:16S rRNA (guanine527-N7)-methyltransferase
MSVKPAPLIDSPQAFEAAFGVSRETIAKLEAYADLLKRWQKTINLVAPSTLPHIWHRHFADSAQLWGLRPPQARNWLDLGSGAGFPGLVLAILASETGGSRHWLVESDNRKAAFLREVARSVGVSVDILCARIENAENASKVGAVDCVTARALAPMPLLLEYASPYFASHTMGLFLKGFAVTSELEDAGRTWEFETELIPSLTESEARIVLLKALKARA